jgi:hypothetical protein
MRVESFELHAEVGEFDPTSGELTVFARSSAPGRPLSGHYTRLGNESVVFFRDHGRLHLRVGGKVFEVNEALQLDWRLVRDRESELTVSSPGSESIRLQYASGPPGPPLSEDPTPFVSDEDWDFGLFIKNVITNQDRSEIIYRA